MHIGIAAPLATADIIDLLGFHDRALPLGYPGAPLIGTLIRSLIKRGHTISVFTTDEALPISNGTVVITHEYLTVYFVPKRRSAFMWRDNACGKAWDLFALERSALVRAIKLAAPDVVHAHWSYEFAWAAIDSGIPHLVTAHDSPSHVLRQSLSLYRAVRYAMARSVFSRASVVSAVSPFVRDAIQPWVRNSVHVVGNPLNTAKQQLMQKNHISSSRTAPVISVVMNGWQRLKNPENAFRSFSLLRKRIPAATLHAYGSDFGQGGKAERWCCERGLEDGCRFHGHLPFQQLQAAISNSDLMLHTSRLESCPMGILEAMSHGIPIVGGMNSGGVPWVVGGAGILTDIENPQMIADSMWSLLTDSALYERCSQAAISRSQIDFGAETIAASYEDLYAEALSRSELGAHSSLNNQRNAA